jgi:hypothetical protein
MRTILFGLIVSTTWFIRVFIFWQIVWEYQKTRESLYIFVGIGYLILALLTNNRINGLIGKAEKKLVK